MMNDCLSRAVVRLTSGGKTLSSLIATPGFWALAASSADNSVIVVSAYRIGHGPPCHSSEPAAQARVPLLALQAPSHFFPGAPPGFCAFSRSSCSRRNCSRRVRRFVGAAAGGGAGEFGVAA